MQEFRKENGKIALDLSVTFFMNGHHFPRIPDPHFKYMTWKILTCMKSRYLSLSLWFFYVCMSLNNRNNFYSAGSDWKADNYLVHQKIFWWLFSLWWNFLPLWNLRFINLFRNVCQWGLSWASSICLHL
jgi:hypothetical protein